MYERLRQLGIVCAVVGCTAEVGEDPFDVDALTFPSPEDLPESVEPPAALTRWSDGVDVTDVDGWEATRRPEVGRLFDHYVYGAVPDGEAEVVSRTVTSAWGGEVEVVEARVGDVPFTLTIVRPAATAPVVLGLNKCGTQTLDADPSLPVSTRFAEESCETTPGFRASYWDLRAAVAAGVAVATVHQSDFAPDDPELPRPVDGLVDPEVGTIAAWSYGLSRAVDLLAADDRFDEIVVFGHSRRGKAALWAGANDPRIDRVWAHQSGTVGATLSRSSAGESVLAINALFPHWFPDVFDGFDNRETHLPVDQHLLLAMIAPRPLLISDGAADQWADPDGATASVDLAAEVYALYGEAPPTRVIREGGHDVRGEDWSALFQTLDD